MISYVWRSDKPFLAGSGGTENYTAGHIRELKRRGIAARIITIPLGGLKESGSSDFPDIEFLTLESEKQLGELDDTLIFATPALPIPTKRPTYGILHCPLTLCDEDELLYSYDISKVKLIAPSQFAARLWARHFKRPAGSIPVVYPFAEACFAAQPEPIRPAEPPRVLYASRLSPDKGIYTLLAALHLRLLREAGVSISVTSAGAHAREGSLIAAMLKTRPDITFIPARRTPETMAALLGAYDVVVIPSTDNFWYETFGILSVEAQHAGCRVVASHGGGLPETDCGGLVLVEPDNPLALAKGIIHAASLGRLTPQERQAAGQQFTARQSVDSLLATLS